MSEVGERIRAEVEAIRLIDNHEHIMSEEEREDRAADLSYLLSPYVCIDMVSAGMARNLMESVRFPMGHLQRSAVAPPVLGPVSEDMPLEERWAVMAPYWGAMRNTAYSRCFLIAIRDLFGFEDLNDSTYAELAQAVADSRRPGWYKYILSERAGIELAVNDVGTTEVDRDFFVPVVRLDHFIMARTRQELAALEEETDVSIHSLDDLVRALEKALENYIQGGIVGIKCALGYFRNLCFEKPTQHEAEVVFNRAFSHLGEGPSWSEAKPLQDYMMRQVIRLTIEAGLPMQVHTGLTQDRLTTDTNPAYLTNLFEEYREAKFDVFHAGYPHCSELATLAKNYANVYPNMCWMYMISPEMGRRALHEWIETVPGNKIMAFGGDGICAEYSYAHSRMAREAVARVLTEKVEDGYFEEEEALTLARKMLRDNPADLLGLTVD